MRSGPWLAILAALALVAPAPAADARACLQAALRQFQPEIPPGWAYTVTTRRGADTSTERFDPAQDLEHQWTLLRLGDRTPTPDEAGRYASYRTSTSPSLRPAFHRGDLDLGTLALVREDATSATFRCRFRSEASEGLLAHLALTLEVTKEQPHVRRTVLELVEPYSPVLTMKMLELRLETTYAEPAAGQTSLPRDARSHFRGTVFFFKSVAEDLELAYADFTPVRPREPERTP